eukprot:TRINITY_DN3551_c0_g1_i1.p1 TRINITY_DN3551_c0_g1~~TRINITY_DN3551_c0_g1_i1.p1  ORF type:complete len:94 (+),score=44.30 TRINITY_DN3551_c0_g1_i1:400-681(+)
MKDEYEKMLKDRTLKEQSLSKEIKNQENHFQDLLEKIKDCQVEVSNLTKTRKILEEENVRANFGIKKSKGRKKEKSNRTRRGRSSETAKAHRG